MSFLDLLAKGARGKGGPRDYSGRDGAGFEPRVNHIAAEFVDLIERKYLSTLAEFRPIDFAHKAQYFTLDVISYLGLGEALGFLSNDEDMYDYVAINDSMLPTISVLLTIPWADGILKSWPFNKMLLKDGDNVGFGMLIG
ncbi:hypothetical protein B0H67DRAFT_641449 [Lasiosphaeris hirsuta]|uniref:Uncharacterized protein n=1 Tax=Lasiosphaeris hirsuta TaxID=260670 RepID=A0AA40AZN5_9PEZI|nr:hypothetical protein B0H67DRAFT_641449 [Lasiosphaeris hirsuta]